MTFSKLPFNVSPKLAHALVSLVIAWLVARYAIQLPEGLAETLAITVAGTFGYRADSGDVIPAVGEGSDARLSAETSARLNSEGPA